ncbi:NAD(P)-binding protein [Polyplosphaeria fusca]|uniref:NAD(P)-binding protein n=1 Tax=Polyplosphaeria fusca TaxID=682080 RepID=A0A9P4R785_9PLEO|nr:NAD(P)-binding protein [Polyplosphaeria fusca]
MSTPYDSKSTAAQVAADNAAQIAGKVVLTTGVSPGGTGATFVETIAAHNPSLLILAGRSASKVQATADKIASEHPNVQTRVLLLDLASQTQIRAAAAQVLAYPEPAVDVLVNSAGIMAGPYRETEDGLEAHWGSNHIGHFLFTNLIMPKILASRAPRIVNVTSDGHRASPIRFSDPNFSKGKEYNQWLAYSQSKTANILFSKALAQKLGARGLKSFSLHPGVIFGTALSTDVSDEDFADLKRIDKELGEVGGNDDFEWPMKTLQEGAATHVVAAFDPRIEAGNGGYLADGHLAPEEMRPTVRKEEDVEKLWKLSEETVGQTFEF